MGRVYGLSGGPDVRSGTGYRFFTHTGEKVRHLFHVAFDADADEGMATVRALAHTEHGTPLVDFEKNDSCKITYRTWLRAVPRGEPDPPKTPDAVLWRNADGSLRWCERDPLPDEAVEAINRAGVELATR